MPTGYEVQMYHDIQKLARESEKQTKALEVIAASLEKIANSPMVVEP